MLSILPSSLVVLGLWSVLGLGLALLGRLAGGRRRRVAADPAALGADPAVADPAERQDVTTALAAAALALTIPLFLAAAEPMPAGAATVALGLGAGIPLAVLAIILLHLRRPPADGAA